MREATRERGGAGSRAVSHASKGEAVRERTERERERHRRERKRAVEEVDNERELERQRGRERGAQRKLETLVSRSLWEGEKRERERVT